VHLVAVQAVAAGQVWWLVLHELTWAGGNQMFFTCARLLQVTYANRGWLWNTLCTCCIMHHPHLPLIRWQHCASRAAQHVWNHLWCMQLLPTLLVACCVFVMSLVDAPYLYHACYAQHTFFQVCLLTMSKNEW